MTDFKNVYFIGIGGIGMSSLARYFREQGKKVAGYDRTETALTRSLEREGIPVHYEEDMQKVDAAFLNPSDTLVVFTPAVPAGHSELVYFREHGFEVLKRSQILGAVTEGKYVMAVAGTHGKTTTTTMTAWFNALAADDKNGEVGGGYAFLGGISKNFDSNLVLGRGRRVAVEADEFDRSFLRLYPDVALVTSVDADHLDIYKNHESLKESFSQFVSQIKKGGVLVYRRGIDLRIENKEIKIYTYSLDDVASDFHAVNLVCDETGSYHFDIVCPDRVIEGCKLGIPGHINVENCVGAVSLLWVAGFDEEKLKEAIASFSGVKRRFDFYINTPSLVYMDDYAHHPRELRAAIESVREMFPGRKVTAVFQPHLYTRTRDFADGFAESLSLVDELLLIPIYPAREEPIEGVSSRMIHDKVAIPNKRLVSKTELMGVLEKMDLDILITFGAGDIDAFCEPIYNLLKQKR